MSQGFISGFASWLASEVALDVLVAAGGETVEAGRIVLAPGNANLVVEPPGVLRLNTEPAPAGIVPSVDLLFASLADCYGAATVGVVLTGIGTDGAQGVEAIKAAGGMTLAQDEESCVVFGMPGAAVASGAVDEVAPVERIVQRLMSVAESLPAES
jgi:two-component system chemotaxis response regulator CheB